MARNTLKLNDNKTEFFINVIHTKYSAVIITLLKRVLVSWGMSWCLTHPDRSITPTAIYVLCKVKGQ